MNHLAILYTRDECPVEIAALAVELRTENPQLSVSEAHIEAAEILSSVLAFAQNWDKRSTRQREEVSE